MLDKSQFTIFFREIYGSYYAKVLAINRKIFLLMFFGHVKRTFI